MCAYIKQEQNKKSRIGLQVIKKLKTTKSTENVLNFKAILITKNSGAYSGHLNFSIFTKKNSLYSINRRSSLTEASL